MCPHHGPWCTQYTDMNESVADAEVRGLWNRSAALSPARRVSKAKQIHGANSSVRKRPAAAGSRSLSMKTVMKKRAKSWSAAIQRAAKKSERQGKITKKAKG